MDYRVLLALLAILALGGCGTTLEGFSRAGQLISAADRAIPLIGAVCKNEAAKCRASSAASQPVKLEACPAAAKCLTALRGYRAALDSADAAIVVGLPLAMVEHKTATTWLTAAMDALAKAGRIVSGLGLFGGVR
ncbi:MAG: hypothetical protein KKB59_18345 [Spirochaetes bacterium]|nr:hypothetical protein [Spirochaetota bacterium]